MAALREALKHGQRFDNIVIGGGHNGLVASAYLARAGKSVCVCERRHVIGGAAVTEEIVPDFKFSRASYLVSLLRPQIVKDLNLKAHGLKIHLRNPNSFTPIRGSNKSLLLGNNHKENQEQLAQFSEKDAQVYGDYEEWMNTIADAVEPLLDSQPVDLSQLPSSFLTQLPNLSALGKMAVSLGRELPSFYHLLTAPASKILDIWFESEPLKATLATDAVIGANLSPRMTGSGYVLLHHVMGELEGIKNAWGFAEGGNGAVSDAIARSALEHGAVIATDSPVAEIVVDGDRVAGVELEDGTLLLSDTVLSNATPKVTFIDLLPEGVLSDEHRASIEAIDYTSPVTKINVALSGLPSFSCSPSSGGPLPHHQCTIHLNTESMDSLHTAYLEAQNGRYSTRPMLEVCLPSVLDHTLAPHGCHVMSIFSQYTPYTLEKGPWTESFKQQYRDTVFDCIEDYAPGFRKLVVGSEVLTPPDLESIFGLTGGNIFHGSMSLDQLYMSRPTPLGSSTSVRGLYLCGSGAHPGGGVMGSPGRLAAMAALNNKH